MVPHETHPHPLMPKDQVATLTVDLKPLGGHKVAVTAWEPSRPAIDRHDFRLWEGEGTAIWNSLRRRSGMLLDVAGVVPKGPGTVLELALLVQTDLGTHPGTHPVGRAPLPMTDQGTSVEEMREIVGEGCGVTVPETTGATRCLSAPARTFRPAAAVTELRAWVVWDREAPACRKFEWRPVPASLWLPKEMLDPSRARRNSRSTERPCRPNSVRPNNVRPTRARLNSARLNSANLILVQQRRPSKQKRDKSARPLMMQRQHPSRANSSSTAV